MSVKHHYRWRTPTYLLLCGAKNGKINLRDPSDITCKTCLKIMAKRDISFQRKKWGQDVRIQM